MGHVIDVVVAAHVQDGSQALADAEGTVGIGGGNGGPVQIDGRLLLHLIKQVVSRGEAHDAAQADLISLGQEIARIKIKAHAIDAGGRRSAVVVVDAAVVGQRVFDFESDIGGAHIFALARAPP